MGEEMKSKGRRDHYILVNYTQMSHNPEISLLPKADFNWNFSNISDISSRTFEHARSKLPSLRETFGGRVLNLFILHFSIRNSNLLAGARSSCDEYFTRHSPRSLICSSIDLIMISPQTSCTLQSRWLRTLFSSSIICNKTNDHYSCGRVDSVSTSYCCARETGQGTCAGIKIRTNDKNKKCLACVEADEKAQKMKKVNEIDEAKEAEAN